ncbi:NDR1/HIN1-like protein 6 [Brachypodium distachyon]|uniref:Late embryogenesis abundant protein LEA-2 subgroup domain-containing protein n=1 Tax=Brachypodium distachyon TaxID=15368 RepID=I1HCY6_BRADI|nr:NDR1/HIN1-like protein 6 [Brachypodium distachyon]KQK03159.1 hypothetical protein BRADI_2g05927v3 [Brachypodium distachyon]|eukprot:XP_003564907.1 NDR1/HIN1-like protein 6 [Brachypodium distachyon]
MSSNGKPNPQPPAAASNGAATGGPPKMYQRPIYRPQGPSSKGRRGGRGRSCPFSCCCCFFWTILVVLLLAFAAAVAGGAFYLLYRPHRPAFTLSLARVNKLALSNSSAAPALTDSIDFTLTARNPNKKLVFLYDDFAVSAATAANAVPLGDAAVPGFAHEAGNITVIKATVAASALGVDPAAASSDIKKSGSFAITLDLETKAGVKVGGLRTKKIGIQVHCDGIKVAAPATAPAPAAKKKGVVKLTVSKAPAPAAAAGVVEAPEPSAGADDAATGTPATATAMAPRVCQVRIRVKIWRWTF